MSAPLARITGGALSFSPPWSPSLTSVELWGGRKVGQVGILTGLVGVTTRTIATGQSFSRNGNTGE